MNKHQIKGTGTAAAGKIQRKAGTAVSSRKHEIKGGAKELVGKAQLAYGNAKEDAKKSRARQTGRA
jgi:uncharacterized protein YjbJ (UPF0337 family)